MPPAPDRSTFEIADAGQAPWDIGSPQKPFVNVADRITGGWGKLASTLPGKVRVDFTDSPKVENGRLDFGDNPEEGLIVTLAGRHVFRILPNYAERQFGSSVFSRRCL